MRQTLAAQAISKEETCRASISPSLANQTPP